MRGKRSRRGTSTQRSAGCVTFPSHSPVWGQVRVELEALLLVTDLNDLTQRLDRIHHLSQGKEETDARQVTVFKGLNVFLTKAEEGERRRFLDTTFPTVVSRALELEELIPPDGVPLLLRQQAGHVVLSRRFIASLVACGFLCIFPKLQPRMKDGFRSINFNNFFQHLTNEAQQAKLRCILHYFERLAENQALPAGNITFTRKVLEASEARDLDWWQETDIPLCPLIVHHNGVIEDAPHPCIQVDFANRKIGGGVLAAGKVQEEIRFVTTPELLATMLIFEAMDENEAIWVSGFETFSAHEGYGKTLRFVGDFRDKTPINRHGNLCSILCAMDALTGASQRQYQDKFILREVNKAFIGFLQKCSGGGDAGDIEDIDRFSETLSQEIITTAAHQAAIVLTHARLADHPRLPSDRHVMRSDSSDTSSESHHSFSSGAGEADRSWNMNFRRRSSNLSDVGSRRSSDLASRRSSGSTRYSSDLSSDLEELYESFQRQESRQRPAAIKEELPAGAASGIQDYVSSMVSNVVEESSSLAAQMMPGVQNFGGVQPPDVAKPRAYKPQVTAQEMGIDFTVDLDSSSDSSNQTDDQKAKENIVRFVSQLVEKAYSGARGGADEDPSSSDQLSLHHSWSGSESSGSPRIPHYLDASPRAHAHESSLGAGGSPGPPPQPPHCSERGHRTSQPTIDPSSWISQPLEVSARCVYRQDSYNQRMSHLEGSPRSSSHAESSPRISQLDGSPRSEATAMWRHQEALLLSEFARMNGRRRSSTDYPGSDSQRPSSMIADPSSGAMGSRGYVHGESLTDDFKEAVANSASAFHAVQAAAAAAAAGAMPIRGEEEHIPFPYVPNVSDLPDIRNMPETRPASSYRESRSNFHSKSETSLLSYRHSSHGNVYHRQDAIDSGPGQEGATGYNPIRVSGSANALAVAGQIVQQSLDSAVRAATQQVQACGGAASWRNMAARRDSEQSNSSQPRHTHFGRSLSMSKPRRKGSMDESLSSLFAHSLARHSSLGELSNSLQQRRGSSGFRDSTLSNFADELLDTSVGVPDSNLFDVRRHSVGGEQRSGLFRRGSGESRTSSLSRHSSTDVLFPACSTPEETPPPWALNRGRRSSREVVLELLSSSALSDSSGHRRQAPSSDTSHLDWFAQDLLMEAFNDAFIELFGQDYLESIDYQRRQVRARSCSCSRGEKDLFHFADGFVQNVLQEAIQVLTSEGARSKRHQRVPSEEEEVGSNYEDALDVPFPMIESYASSLAGNIVDQARKDVVRQQLAGPRAIATGNWGCGAFRGNPQLKCLLQWATASCAGAPAVHYYTFGSPEVRQLPEVRETIRARGWNVGHILQYVVQYARQHRYRDQSLPSLFDSLLQ